MCSFSLNMFKHNKYSVDFIFLTKSLVDVLQSGVFLHHYPKESLHFSVELDPLCFQSDISFFSLYSIILLDHILSFSEKKYKGLISCFCPCSFEEISSLSSHLIDVEF